MIKFLIGVFCICFVQNAFAQGLGEQSAYIGGKGSGYAVSKVSITIGANGIVEGDFAKPLAQILSASNTVSFTDTLLHYNVSAFSTEGKLIKLRLANKELQLIGHLKTGIYWITLARSGRKETYKLIKN